MFQVIIFYIGDQKWNMSLKISNYFEILEELKEYGDDWKIKVVDTKGINTSRNKNE